MISPSSGTGEYALTGLVGDVVRAEPFGEIEIDVAELFGRET